MKTDPLEVAIEDALEPGRFIEEREEWDFVATLETVAKPLLELVKTDATRAVRLYEAFLAGCYEKAEEGHWEWLFGNFVEGLWCGWLRARQAAGADVDETARRLLARMEDDPYCFAFDITAEAVKVMGRAQLAAFERAALAQFAEPTDGADARKRTAEPEYTHRRRNEILRKIYIHRGDVKAFIELCGGSGLSPEDCLNLAKMLKAKRKPAEALTWVDRGLAARHPPVSSAGLDLAKLRRELHTKLGRSSEAIEDAWREFCEHPHKCNYDDLMKLVPAADRSAWHTKAIDMAGARANLESLLDLWLETKEYGRLVARVKTARDAELEALSHYLNDRVAAYLDKPHPALAARVYRALGMRILAAKKSKYYSAAIQNFEDARRCYAIAGLEAQWSAVVAEVRGTHSRKTGFMRDFERVVQGRGSDTEPSFLERARGRWFAEDSR